MSTQHVPTSLDRREAHTPDTHLLFSVVSLIFCLPVGIAAVLASTKVNVAVGMNNMVLARESSARAASLSLTAVFLGSIFSMLLSTLVLVIIYQG